MTYGRLVVDIADFMPRDRQVATFGAKQLVLDAQLLCFLCHFVEGVAQLLLCRLREVALTDDADRTGRHGSGGDKRQLVFGNELSDLVLELGIFQEVCEQTIDDASSKEGLNGGEERFVLTLLAAVAIMSGTVICLVHGRGE